MVRIFAPAAIVVLMQPLPSHASDLHNIAAAWQTFMQDCQQMLGDPRAYAQTLPAIGYDNEPSSAVTPDDQIISIAVEKPTGLIVANAWRLPGREKRYCSFVLDLPLVEHIDTRAAQYVSWLNQNPDLNVVGGRLNGVMPYYDHAVLGVFPEFDVMVTTELSEVHFGLYAVRIVPMP